MKKGEFDKIKAVIQKADSCAHSAGKERKKQVIIFDSATAIEVCRQNTETLLEATKLAEKT